SDSIADGDVLYSCRVNIAPTAPMTTLPLRIGDIHASTPAGNSIPATGADGGVVVVSASPSPTPLLPPRPVIVVGSATDLPNRIVQFDVVLNAMDTMVA